MKLNFFENIYYKILFNKLDKSKLDKEQEEVVELNIKKHSRIFLLMLLIMPYVYFITSKYYIDKIDTVITSLFGVLFISGTAWFAITFGAVPIRFMDFAIHLTAYLFTAFAVSVASVFTAASIAVPLLSPILFIAFFTLYAASVKFDIIDALKLGIDDTIYQNAKVGRMYFLRELEKEDKTNSNP